MTSVSESRAQKLVFLRTGFQYRQRVAGSPVMITVTPETDG